MFEFFSVDSIGNLLVFIDSSNMYFPNCWEQKAPGTRGRPVPLQSGRRLELRSELDVFYGGKMSFFFKFLKKIKAEGRAEAASLFLRPDLHAVTTLLFDFFLFSFFFCSSAAFDSLHHLLLTSEASCFLYLFFSALCLMKRPGPRGLRRLLSLHLHGLCKLYRRWFLIRRRRSFYQGNSTPSSVVCSRLKTHTLTPRWISHFSLYWNTLV